MTEDLRPVATEIQKLGYQVALSSLLVRWDIGALIIKVMGDQAKYGSRAVELMAAYTGFKSNLLYELANFARSFDHRAVEELCGRRMLNGDYLGWEHLVMLARIGGDKKRENLIEQTLSQSLSTRQLHSVIQVLNPLAITRGARGRKPATPRSPIAGARQVYSFFSRVNHRLPLWETVADNITVDLEPSRIDTVLLQQLKQGRSEFAACAQKIPVLREKLQRAIEQCKQVLAARRGEDIASPAKETPKKAVSIVSRGTRSKRPEPL
jgi:hypothetical protein